PGDSRRTSELENRAGGKRQAVVGRARASRLLRGHAARADNERPAGRERDIAFEADRAESILREAAGAAAQDRRVVLAASEGPDAAVAGERAEGEAVLHGAEITGEVLGTAQAPPVILALPESV